jgi:hemoglobin
MTITKSIAALLLACAVVVPAFGQQAPTLYKRLGGYDAVAAVTDDFLARLAANPQFAKFFVGHGTDSIKRIRQNIVDQLCAATGGPCIYLGRDMKTTHGGLGITEKDWEVSVKDLVATLDKFSVPVKEKDEVLAAISGLKKDIVEKPWRPMPPARDRRRHPSAPAPSPAGRRPTRRPTLRPNGRASGARWLGRDWTGNCRISR